MICWLTGYWSLLFYHFILCSQCVAYVGIQWTLVEWINEWMRERKAHVTQKHHHPLVTYMGPLVTEVGNMQAVGNAQDFSPWKENVIHHPWGQRWAEYLSSRSELWLTKGPHDLTKGNHLATKNFKAKKISPPRLAKRLVLEKRCLNTTVNTANTQTKIRPRSRCQPTRDAQNVC